jgi:lipopolysaccharide/colanic/teichoic acid biosynthesis glycosyltransferase
MIRPTSAANSWRMIRAVVGDFLIAWGTLVAAIELRRATPLPFTRALLPPESFVLDAVSVLLFGSSFILAFGVAGFYRRRITPRSRPILTVALLIQVALVTVGTTALERPLPRTILLGVVLLEAIALPLWRWLQKKIWSVRPRETILVGEPAEIAAAFAVLEAATDRQIHVIGYAGSERAGVGVAWLGPLDDASVRTAIREVEEVIYVCPDATARLELLRIRGPRGYLVLASPADALLISSMLGWMGDEPLIEVSIGCGYGALAVVKRAIDVGGAIALTVLSSPLWLLVAATIWLDDRGPILLRQMRLGLGGVPYGMWKFRSMRDSRVTRAGSLLRRYRLDELPQLVNVIAGDMSLVGPRPERPEIAELILTDLPDFDLRCLVRPGMAGLAQILAEYDSRPAVKLRYDLTYMCSWSLWLDVRLLFSSVAAALSGSGI